MPVAWLRIPTCSSPDVEKFHGKPVELKAFVEKVVTNAGATLTDLYFDVAREYAYALVVSLDDPIKTRAVNQILGVDDMLKVVTAEQAKKALGLETRYRPRPDDPKKK
jgi:hypothetical protein